MDEQQVMMHSPGVRKLGFLDLPPELRNNIYALAFDYDGHKVAIPLTWRISPKSDQGLANHQVVRTPELRFLETCKEIYNEALGYHYSTASIYWSDAPAHTNEGFCWKCIRYHNLIHVNQMQRSMSLYKDKLHHVTHLNISGADAKHFFLFTGCKPPDTRGAILKPLDGCAWIDARVTRVAGRLTAHLKHVHTVTIFFRAEDEYSDDDSEYELEFDSDSEEFRDDVRAGSCIKTCSRRFPSWRRSGWLGEKVSKLSQRQLAL